MLKNFDIDLIKLKYYEKILENFEKFKKKSK